MPHHDFFYIFMSTFGLMGFGFGGMGDGHSTATVPTLALRDRAGNPILDRAGAYILTRT